MIAISLTKISPKFKENQIVDFIGGIGRIKHCHFEFSHWIYCIEMGMGPEPSFGRIGYETMILMPEVDIISVIK